MLRKPGINFKTAINSCYLFIFQEYACIKFLLTRNSYIKISASDPRPSQAPNCINGFEILIAKIYGPKEKTSQILAVSCDKTFFEGSSYLWRRRFTNVNLYTRFLMIILRHLVFALTNSKNLRTIEIMENLFIFQCS